MTETTVSDAVLARLEALTARLDEQASRIAGLEAEHARLMGSQPSDTGPAAEMRGTTASPTVARERWGRQAVGAAILKRRGLLAGVAALLGAGLAKLGPAERAEATHTGGGTPNVDSTAIHDSPGNVVNRDVGVSRTGLAFNADVNGRVVSITAPGAHAILAGNTPTGAGRFGVVGHIGPTSGADTLNLLTTTPVAGVWGVSAGGDTPGVLGQSRDAAGIQGVSTNNAGVYGVGPIGVFATGTGTAAVYGASNGTYGVWGNSGASAGLIGTSAGYIGVEAISTSHWGLRAKSPNYAGVFEGNVFVTGQVIALGGVVGVSGASARSAAGALAEDVGEGTLTNGRATVTLGPEFAEAANGEYRVFLTELADLGGLYVVRKGPREFEVRSRGGAGQAAANGRFDYRVVAKTAGPRQAPPAPPDLTTVKPTPKPPEPPRAPDPSGTSDELRRP